MAPPNRRAYVRKNESRVEDLRVRRDEVTTEALTTLDTALDTWLVGRKSGTRSATPPPPRQFHRPWQRKERSPLWLLLAKAELANAIDQGKAQRAELSTDGWEEQRLDGDKPAPTPLW